MMTFGGMMTFKEFQETRKPCEDIGKAISADLGGDEPVSGVLYLDCLYIADSSMPGCNWWLQIGREEYMSDELYDLERRLYDFAISEGYIVDPGTCSNHRDDGRGFCVDCGGVI